VQSIGRVQSKAHQGPYLLGRGRGHRSLAHLKAMRRAYCARRQAIINASISRESLQRRAVILPSVLNLMAVDPPNTPCGPRAHCECSPRRRLPNVIRPDPRS
jgi:hypothetical protein